MIDSFYIAWKYIWFNKVKTATLVACITLIAFLPLALQRLLEESESQFMTRALSTPLLIGAKGSALDLVMSALYFTDQPPAPITMQASHKVKESKLAAAIPVYVRFKVRDHPIVGTTLDYFDFRGLDVVQGRPLGFLGDCVLGASVARAFGLGPGDNLVSSPDNLFDLAGVYPLKMNVVGVLAQSSTPDDDAIFVDLKTTWVIQGLGHGHSDLAKTSDESVILGRTKSSITANAKLPQYTEITPANRASFHFHGDPAAYPITAIIAVPYDSKSATILTGRFVSAEERNQIIKPVEVIDGLLQNIFRIKRVLDAVIVVVGLAMVLVIVLVFALSLRLREREINTIFMLGCSRMTVARLIAAEIFIIALASGLICMPLLILVDYSAADAVRLLLIQ